MKPGDWYYAVACENCKQPIAFAHDKRKLGDKINFAGPGILQLTCAACGHEGRYQTAQVVSHRAEQIH